MKPFEQYLRLLLALFKFKDPNGDDCEEFDLLQDQMDKPWYEMNAKERILIGLITSAINSDNELPDYLLGAQK